MTAHILGSIDPVVLGAQLASARKARGLTQQATAEALGLSRTTVIAMEKGDRRPKAAELVQLAALYGRKVGELVRPVTLGSVDSFVVQFRAARRSGATERDEKRDADIREFEALCRDYAELEHLTGSSLPRRYPDVYDIRGSNIEQAADEVATSERNRLGLGDGPIGDLWGILETDVGLRVFSQAFADSRLAGLFVYTEDLGGCIAVNRNHPEERQRWTAAHEYAHFLVDRYRAEITVLPSYRRVPESERFAGAFAGHFLMPSTSIIRRFQAMRRAKEGPVTPADVLVLADLYQVSFAALMIRLESLGLVTSGSWDRLREQGFKPTVGRERLGIPTRSHSLPALPLRYEALAAEAYAKGHLSQERLAQMLRTDHVGARMRVQQLKRSEFYDDGDFYQLSLDFEAALTTAGR